MKNLTIEFIDDEGCTTFRGRVASPSRPNHFVRTRRLRHRSENVKGLGNEHN